MTNKPTSGMVSEAKKGLDWRSEYGRGGTEVGIARARDISNGKNLSDDTVKRMYSFFSRHEVDKKAEGFRPGEDGYPSNGRIAWALWGGDAGFSWSRKLADRMEKERSMENVGNSDIMPENIEGEVMTEVRDAETETVADEVIDEVRQEETECAAEEPTDGAEETRLAPEKLISRAVSAEKKVIDVEARRVQIAVSSEEPVERGYGNEVLDHSERSIDLSFLNSGRAPLLLDHDPRQQIGVVESVTLDGSARRLRATVRFGKNGLAKDVFDDVSDGIRSNISVGYQVNKLEQDGKGSYRAVDWLPMEVSVVSIPADRTVGVGRSADDDLQHRTPNPTPQKEATMSDIDIEAVKAEAVRAAAKDHAEIYALGGKHQQRDMAEKAVAEGRTLAEFRGELLNVIGNKPLDNTEIGLAPKEVRQFSLLKAIRAHANPTDRAAQQAAAFELEASAAASEAYGREAQGIMIPNEVLRSWAVRDLNTTDDAAVIADDFRGGSFIDVLRNQSSVMQAGATMLSGLSGNVKIPKKTAASAASWISTEGGAASESEPTLGQVTMAPKTLGAFTDITRLMMMQSSLDIEALVRNDLSTAIALAIDLGALAGTGSSGQPTGVKNTSGINAPTNFAAANPTFAEVVAMETAVAEDNALSGNLAYIAPAGMYGALKTTAKDAGSGQFVVGPDGNMNGYNTIVSNQVTAGDLYFGNFADLLIGMYGGLDIVVDPYTSSTSGTVRIVALQTCDVAVRHAVSFAFNNDGA
jgi:HK97 family phage major capsid protein/HK97 family phage prohead protease